MRSGIGDYRKWIDVYRCRQIRLTSIFYCEFEESKRAILKNAKAKFKRFLAQNDWQRLR